MNIPSLDTVETNLRHCLLLKADDLYFTLSEPHGKNLRNDFLGMSVEGLADENLSENEIASIDLDRFSIAHRLRQLHSMISSRHLSLDRGGWPDAEYGRNDALDFLEHFLSTLPEVSLGAIDLTAVRNGCVRTIYNLSYAWLNLTETIGASFEGETESALSVCDLALLSGLDTRTLRNRCGPGKLIRTSTNRTLQERNIASPAFVYLHALDALDWLRNRKDFAICKIDPAWIKERIAEANPANVSRGLLATSVINIGTLAEIGSVHGFSPEQARTWFDQGEVLPASITTALTQQLDVSN